jgi:uncharacterized membrane protein
MTDGLRIFLLSTLPLSELRVTIPLAIHKYGFSPLEAVALSVAGVMLAVMIIFLLIDPVVKLLRRISIFDRFFSWLFKWTKDRHSKRMKIWGNLALFLIAVTPFPGSGGGWTSALVAYLFDLNRTRSIIIITIGTIVSGLIVLAITQGVITIF